MGGPKLVSPFRYRLPYTRFKLNLSTQDIGKAKNIVEKETNESLTLSRLI